MKIELTSSGLDQSLNTIEKDLKSALNTKNKKRKDELVYHALGAVNALYLLVRVAEDSEDTSRMESRIIQE